MLADSVNSEGRGKNAGNGKELESMLEQTRSNGMIEDGLLGVIPWFSGKPNTTEILSSLCQADVSHLGCLRTAVCFSVTHLSRHLVLLLAYLSPYYSA